MKVLVVDDDHINLSLNRELMEDWGYEYDLAGNGAEAVAQARNNAGQYDICLMDIDMPVMNGLKAAKIIRETMKYFPIIATSANYDYERDCLTVGIDEFIRKPYDSDTLYEKLNEFNVKQLVLHIQNDQLILTTETPMDQQHAKEIKQLKEDGLVKVRFGTNGEDLILHKFATNKISHDFISKGQMISVFLNHDPDKPTRCEL